MSVCVSTFYFTSTEARWLIRDGDRGEEDDRVKARPRKPPEKDRRDRGPPPEQWKRLVHCAIAVSTAVLGQSHKDNVRCTAVDQQLGQLAAKAVQLS